MHIAARYDNIEVATILIEFDARIGRRNYQGLTPIGVARMNGNANIVRLLDLHYAVDAEKSSNREEPERDIFNRVNLDSIPSQSMLREEEKQQLRRGWGE